MARYLPATGLAIGALFGVAGSFVTGTTQGILWEISSLGLIIGAILLAGRSGRNGEDEVAAGFVLLAIAEAVMSGGTAAGLSGSQAAFAAGTALYVPALLFIGGPKSYPVWVRLAGILAAIPFAITAFRIYAGGEVLPGSELPSAGYGLLTIAMIGWILRSLKR
ncbi:MAG: hypothetical protein HY563_03945 [Ignavibacteriales bacterium]|nr:hypothetical protein [Ignavibacteriales bacterium]